MSKASSTTSGGWNLGLACAAMTSLLLAVAAVTGHSAAYTTSDGPVVSDAYSETVEGTSGVASYFRMNDTRLKMRNRISSLDFGTYYGSVTRQQPGALGADHADKAVMFNDAQREQGGFAEVPDTPATDPYSFTVELWVRPESLLAYRDSTLVDHVAADGWEVRLDGWSRRLVFAVRRLTDPAIWACCEGGYEQASVSSPKGSVVWGRWLFVAASYSASTRLLSLYQDGELVAEATAGFDRGDSIDPLRVGADGQTLDEIAIYSRPLTRSEVADRYAVAQSVSSSG